MYMLRRFRMNASKTSLQWFEAIYDRPDYSFVRSAYKPRYTEMCMHACLPVLFTCSIH